VVVVNHSILRSYKTYIGLNFVAYCCSVWLINDDDDDDDRPTCHGCRKSSDLSGAALCKWRQINLEVGFETVILLHVHANTMRACPELLKKMGIICCLGFRL